MRDLPPSLAASLASGVTTLCWCVRLERLDGVVLGFTDHDVDIAFDGLTYRAASALGASEIEGGLGFAPGGGDAVGALQSAALREEDIARGRYDGARVERRLVDWTDIGARVLIDVHRIGEIRRKDGALIAELRGLEAELGQEKGRLYRRDCSARLGDAACRVDLDRPDRRATVSVTGVVDDRDVSFAGAAGFAASAFAGGTARILSGAAAGLVLDVLTHRATPGGGRVLLSAPGPAGLAAGDAIALVVGCDKRFATCRDVFANHLNFRGFPHIPTTAETLGYAREGEGGHDGGSLFR
jgi:uncharacterized phage protein (TIGR02218 family)